MEKIVLLLLSVVVLFANENSLQQCNECHNKFSAPPYKKIYSRYLLNYSSKHRVQKAMLDFLSAPSREKSIMPKGMKRRFNPDNHPVFMGVDTMKAVEYLIEEEDVIKNLKIESK